MVISLTTNEVSQIGIDQDEASAVKKPSMPIPVVFRSPLTLIDGINLSTPH